MSANTDPVFDTPPPREKWSFHQGAYDPLRMPDELFDKALASVRRMCVEYAAYQTSSLATELTRLTSQCDDLNANLATSGLECAALRARLASLRTLLADTRPAIVARLATSPLGLDDSLLPRIDAALA